MLSRKDRELEAIHLDRHMLEGRGGYQDQVAALYGGFNHVEFDVDGDFVVHPVVLPSDRLAILQRSLMLCYLPRARQSGDVSPAANYDAAAFDPLMEFIHGSVDSALRILSHGEIRDLGSSCPRHGSASGSFPGPRPP